MEALPVLIVIVAYLLGSLPSGYVYGRLFGGVDIREVGDRYTGAKNVFLNVGVAAGLATALTDFAKGAAAMALARFLPAPEPTIIFVGLAVVAGHIWPIYLRFRDGAGALTAGGALLVILPLQLLILAPLSAITFALSRRTTVAVGVYVLLPLLAWAMGEPIWSIVLPFPVGILVGLRVYRRQARRAMRRVLGRGSR